MDRFDRIDVHEQRQSRLYDKLRELRWKIGELSMTAVTYDGQRTVDKERDRLAKRANRLKSILQTNKRILDKLWAL